MKNQHPNKIYKITYLNGNLIQAEFSYNESTIYDDGDIDSNYYELETPHTKRLLHKNNINKIESIGDTDTHLTMYCKIEDYVEQIKLFRSEIIKIETEKIKEMQKQINKMKNSHNSLGNFINSIENI